MDNALLFLPASDHLAMLDGGPGGMRVPTAHAVMGAKAVGWDTHIEGLWFAGPRPMMSGGTGMPRVEALLLTLDGVEQPHGWLALALAVGFTSPSQGLPYLREKAESLGRFIEVQDGKEVSDDLGAEDTVKPRTRMSCQFGHAWNHPDSEPFPKTCPRCFCDLGGDDD